MRTGLLMIAGAILVQNQLTMLADFSWLIAVVFVASVIMDLVDFQKNLWK